MIHGHGDDLYKSQVQIKANFSTNVWYEADTRPLCDFLSTHLEGIFHYPEPDAGSFRKVAAAYHGLTPEYLSRRLQSTKMHVPCMTIISNSLGRSMWSIFPNIPI